jgi:hypothetical protein
MFTEERMNKGSLDQVNGTTPKRREAKPASSSQSGSAPQRTAPVPPGFPPAPDKLKVSEHGFLGGVVPESYRPVKPASPRPATLRRKAEERGDPIGFFLSLAASHPRATDLASGFEKLARIVRRRALSDPDAFAAEIMNHGMSAAGFLHFRLTYYLERLLSNYDLGRDGGASLPKEVVDVLLPALMQLDRHIGELATMRAAIARQTELARAKRIENDRIEHGHRADTSTGVSAMSNGVHPAVNGASQKRAPSKNGRAKAAKPKDRLELTLECDQPNEEQAIVRLAAQMGGIEFEHARDPLSNEPTTTPS